LALNADGSIRFGAPQVCGRIAVPASVAAPAMFARHALISPSASYIDDVGYVGKFSKDRIRELLQFLDGHYIDWSAAMAPAIMGNPNRSHLAQELGDSIGRMDSRMAYEFARTTFTSDSRADLPLVSRPSLILQCSEDVITPLEAGAYVHRAILKATGIGPHLGAPREVVMQSEHSSDRINKLQRQDCQLPRPTAPASVIRSADVLGPRNRMGTAQLDRLDA
jgi:sigma-B regulation protein RsbQ